MAWMVTVLLFAFWVLGMASGAVLGTWVHLVLLFALVSFVVALSGTSLRRRSRAQRVGGVNGFRGS